MKNSDTLLTDLYEITMAQGYWEQGKADTEACFYMFFRKNPFGGGFVVSCGQDQLAEYIEDFSFSAQDIDYLRSLKAPGGGALFNPDFLDYLAEMELTVDIDAVPEGTVMFPHEPMVRVSGPIMQCQLLEAALLNVMNFETLIATKASRVCRAAQSPVAEFGLRRAQGAAGGVWASRAAIIGGCSSTSNVQAGMMYGLPVSGTHAHSWVMSFDDELTAFRAYAESFPTNCVLLVDTYDVEQGIKNAITVGLEMRARGERLMGIRIDSGDLAWQAKRARRMLDDAGLTDCGIVLSNDLDEYSILAVREEGAKVMSWGVGTKLACAYDQPTLGGVYKLCATRENGSSEWAGHMKISESAEKLTIPGVLDIRRYFNEDGTLAGDMIVDISADGDIEDLIVDPQDSLRRKSLKGLRFEMLLKPFARGGKVVLGAEDRSALASQARARASLATLDSSRRRIMNPHSYPVGLEYQLHTRRSEMVMKLRGI